jgi:hypothetical protein
MSATGEVFDDSIFPPHDGKICFSDIILDCPRRLFPLTDIAQHRRIRHIEQREKRAPQVLMPGAAECPFGIPANTVVKLAHDLKRYEKYTGVGK